MNQQPPAPTPPLDELYGTFCAPITTETVGRFMFCVNAGIQGNAPKMHILFQTMGGNVADGVCLYNFLRTCPLEVVLYNVGTVASIGVVIYLAAKSRVTGKHATFMVHSRFDFSRQYFF
jgi:ATP-dependent Clp protease protease subunit